MDDSLNSPAPRKLRVAYTEGNIFQPIPENGVFTRSSSMPRANQTTATSAAQSRRIASCKLGSVQKPASWTSTLDIPDIGRSLKSSFSLGFLFPDGDDDDDSDELREALLRDEDSDEQSALLHNAEHKGYGTWVNHVDIESNESRSCSNGLDGRYAAIPTARSLPSGLDDEGKLSKTAKKTYHRCQTAPALSNMHREKKGGPMLKRPQFEKGSAIVTHAGIGLMIYLAVGVAIYAWKNGEFSGIETSSVVDALYFCVVTMCTIGYGDIVPVTAFAKLFCCLFVLIGFGFIDALVSGMVTYVLDKQEHLLLSAVEGSHYRTAKKYFLNAKHGNRMRIRMKVGLALGVPVLCIIIGTVMMVKFEGLALVDAFYCTIMSITTVGYGDHTFKTFYGRLFAGLWLLFSTLAVARCFLYLAEARVDKRHRLIAKWVLQRELTVGDLVQADLDHDGCIRFTNFPMNYLSC